MATKGKRKSSAAVEKDVVDVEDQVVMNELDMSTVVDLDDDDTFFQDIDLLQNHGIVSILFYSHILNAMICNCVDAECGGYQKAQVRWDMYHQGSVDVHKEKVVQCQGAL
jgi:hypothetical protein